MPLPLATRGQGVNAGSEKSRQENTPYAQKEPKEVPEAEVKKAKMGTEDLAEDREVCGEQEVQKWEPKEVPEAKVKKAKMGTVVPDEVPEVCGRATTIVALNEVREVFSTSKTPIAWSNPRCCCPG